MRFLQRVVPAIAQNTPGAGIDTSDLVKGFLQDQQRLARGRTTQTIAALAAKTDRKCCGARRSRSWATRPSSRGSPTTAPTSTRARRSISRSTSGSISPRCSRRPVPASNRGIVVYANYLGIYGNCVILDHGLGVQSLYAHLSTMDVKEGETVEKGQVLGRTGMTGLAGGDHLHFTMLVNGVAVNPVEWWDSHWMEDRVFRKIREAGGQAPTLK